MKKKEDIIIEDAKTAEDSGFGQKFIGGNRLINKEGGFNIIKKGLVKNSIYEYLVGSSWIKFFILTFLFFFIVNVFFAFLYFFNGIENLNFNQSNSKFESFVYCLYFSIQTFTSVGYGFLNPQDHFSNIVASINAFSGLLGFALATGLLFSRFSKARVNIQFSKNMLLSPFKEGKSIQFRIINANSNFLMDVKTSVTLTWIESIDGVMRRKFHRLPLELDFIYMFPLNWTLVHYIDQDSPLFEKTIQQLTDNKSELLINIKGFDDTYGQFIYHNHSYIMEDLVENAIFTPMYESLEDNTVLDIEKLNTHTVLLK
jgi:inward rectifier potassium channel